ncbi:carbohydrate ABC transporter permease [Actinopolymorpha pittospori]|uniref:ABC-type sugar transport system permease subunit n=1 Tax=Actinopolymorpha pittospori TaxID=648752 RepID=A0A927MZ90_9ACTN|nr:sugar ABC transporter permease [Actinopolymorpha pittospori]MBE1609294.1 ABC-type sugar transport system permease subunit [Actinopolymorpha pittospori]
MASASAVGVRATRNAKAWLGILLVAPTLVLTVVFFLFPLASSIYFSLTSWNGTTVQAPFVGLSNFTAMATDPEVLHALGNNAIWVVIGTAAPLIVGLVLAVILWTGVSAVLLYRLVFFLPFVLPGVAIGIVWGWIYDPVNGWLNRLLGYVGLEEFARGWLGEPGSALYAVLAAAIWATFGFVVVIFLAALQNVDLDQVDAARLDGAGSLQRLWYVIMPQIMPVFLMVTTITLVGGISVFDIVFIMTGGGPGNATSVLGTYAYENAFQLNKIGYGTALALLITVLSVPIVVLLNHVQRRLSDR